MISLKVNVLYIKLTNLCNLRCEYCFHYTQNNKIDYIFDPNIITYINSEYIKPVNNKILLVLIGGEPLLHWNDIKYIIENIDKNKFNITITTNGGLLSEDIINFGNKHNITFSVSWDGHSSIKTRGYDVMADKYDLLLNIQNLHFSSLLSNESLLIDKYETLNKFRKKYYSKNNTEFTVRMKLIYDYLYTEDSVNNIQNELKQIIKWYKDEPYKNDYVEKFFFGDTYYKQKRPYDLLHCCCANIINFTLTANGYFLYCASDTFGKNVYYKENEYTIIPQKNKIYEKCKECKYQRICCLPCKFMMDDKNKMEMFCKMNENMYKKLLIK